MLLLAQAKQTEASPAGRDAGWALDDLDLARL